MRRRGPSSSITTSPSSRMRLMSTPSGQSVTTSTLVIEPLTMVTTEPARTESQPWHLDGTPRSSQTSTVSGVGPPTLVHRPSGNTASGGTDPSPPTNHMIWSPILYLGPQAEFCDRTAPQVNHARSPTGREHVGERNFASTHA